MPQMLIDQVLQLIKKHNSPVTSRLIAVEIETDRRRVNCALRNLKKKGLIERDRDIFCKDGKWRATWKVKE